MVDTLAVLGTRPGTVTTDTIATIMLDDAWHRFTATQPNPPVWLMLAAGVVALFAVTSPRLWPRARHVVTIAHEGGHAVAALVTGRRLHGILLHSDSSGVTVSRGRASGPGMVLTAAAGYVSPSLLGLAGAALLVRHHVTALLWAAVILLLVMLVALRNAFGVGVVLVTCCVFVAAAMAASPEVQGGFGDLVVWFLLLAGIRPLFELQRRRHAGQAPTSDVDQLARLTGVPGGVWVTLFVLVTLAALALGAHWITA